MMLRRSRDAPTTVVLIHSSDEMYGSDRMVLQVVDSMPSHLRDRLTVVLPINPDGPGALTHALERADVVVCHRELPVLRRRSLTSPPALLLLVWRTLTLAWWLRRQHVGLLFAATSATAPAVVAARLVGVGRTCVHVQEVWGRREGQMLGLMIGLASTVITISRAVFDAMPERVRRRAVVVENGIDTPARPVVQRPENGPLRFLVASRWNTWKGHGTLLSAWNAAEAPPGILVVVGSAPGMGEGVDVAKLVANLKHPESVQVIGQVDSIFDLLDDVDVLVVPSDKPEPFGLVAIEAFSRGRAVIGSAGGGLDDIVDEGVNGMKYAPGDVTDLARVLQHVDRLTLVALGGAGLDKYRSRYSAEAFASRMRQVWDAAEASA